MSAFRIEKTKDFTVMSNYHLQDKKISLNAKGLLSYMLSLPDDWDYSLRGLCAICLEGEKAIRNTLKELEDKGYLYREKINGVQGLFDIVPRVVSRNFKDEDDYLIENKFGYFKNAIYSNINKLNFDIDSLWDNDLNDLYSEDDFER